MEVIIMKIKDIMSTEVASLNSDDSIEKAAQLMKEHDTGSLPVCNQNQVIGIVTDRDITIRCIAGGHDSKQQKVKDIMTLNPFVGSPSMDVHDVAKIMSEKQIRRIPVVEQNNLVGVVALADISLEPALQDNAEQALKNISRPNTK
jgi:CBS domain-containing protein